MRIALGADHAGVSLKEVVKRLLDQRGESYTDFGTDSTESVDYPDFAALVSVEVAAGRFDRGILVCGSGIGMAMTANKFPGIRAAAATDVTLARLSREHNNANVLTLGERTTPPDMARRIVDAFLDTRFAGGRHERRVSKIESVSRPGAKAGS
ncbi:MAG TPA: ribose 5-phosphate isomerase B [Vicinamibacterales bacterium]|nr:ribose 5-phosphate isomerase B [Vicinamibacterales bacterium]